jgi:hypothetical protein
LRYTFPAGNGPSRARAEGPPDSLKNGQGLRNVGLEKRNLHDVAACEVPVKCLNKTSLGADFVHCTRMSR